MHTVKQLAIDLQVSRQSLYDWAAEGCPVHAGKQAIIDWHHTHKRTLRFPVRRSKLLSPPVQPRRDDTADYAIMVAVDLFRDYYEQIDLAIERTEGMGESDLFDHRQWLMGELLIHLRAIFERLPRCWSYDRDKAKQLFDQWYAELDAIIGPTDPRDITPPETENSL